MKPFAHPLLVRLLSSTFLCICMSTDALASPAVDVTVKVGDKLISCNASMSNSRKRISAILHEGTDVSIHWEINVEAVRVYWLNRKVASIDINRRVVPDLVSQNWQLIDLTSGISRRVFDMQEAVRFLTHLDHFPVIDRSLLEKGHVYRMEISVEENEGGARRSWLSTWLGSSSSKTSTDFTLP